MIFKLVVTGFEDGLDFECPLGLTGAETEDVAIHAVKDALAVFRNALATKEKRDCIQQGRIDGIPSPEFQAKHDELLKNLGVAALRGN